ANHEDPNVKISLPVFSIHGNHDDPAGVSHTHLVEVIVSPLSSSPIFRVHPLCVHSICQRDGLSALDLLSASSLINYFGKTDKVDDIKIYPIVISKGQTKL